MTVSRDTLEKLAYMISVLLVIFGSVVPGREIAIGAGMGLIATTVGAKAVTRKEDE